WRTSRRCCGRSAVLLVGSLLPIWTAWHFTPWEGLGEFVTLWRALGAFPDTVQNVGITQQLCDLYRSDLIQGLILHAISAGAGLILLRRLSRRSGSQQDGGRG